MVKRRHTLDTDNLGITDRLAAAIQCRSFFSRFRKRKEFIRHGNRRIIRLIAFIDEENRLTGARCHTHAAADAGRLRVYHRQRGDIFSDLDALFRAGILTRVARDVLRAFHDRMDACGMCDTRIAFYFILRYITLFEQVHRNRNSLFRFFDQLASVFRGKHALSQAFQRGLLCLNAAVAFFLGQISECVCGGNARDATLDHRRARFLYAGNVARNKNTVHTGFTVFIARGDGAALALDHLAARHFRQLRHRRQTNCQTDRIDIKMLFRTGNRLEFAVDLCNGHAGDAIPAVCFDNRMRQIKRHAAARNLCRMHTIAADARCGIDQRDDLTTRLQQLKADNQTDIAGAEHQNTLARLDAMQVHHRLCRACTDDTGQCPTIKGHHVLRRAGCNNNRIRFVMADTVALLDCHLFVSIQSHDDRIQLNADAKAICLVQQLASDTEAAYLCLVLFRAEKFMNLLEQLSARLCILVKDQNIHAGFCRLNRRRKPRWACADDNQIMSFHRFTLSFLRLCTDTILRLYGHAFFERRDTGAHIRFSVDYHNAVGTPSDCTEHAARPVILFGMPVNHHACRLQCDCNRFPFIPLHGPAVVEKGDEPSLLGFAEDWMLTDSHCRSSLFSFVKPIKKSPVESPI